MNKHSLMRELDRLRVWSAINLDDSLTYFVRLISTRGSFELSRSPLIEVTADDWEHFLRYKMDQIERHLGLSDEAKAAPAPAPNATAPAAPHPPSDAQTRP
jgi:hypothetical protein